MPFKPNEIRKEHVLNAINKIEKNKIELISATRWLVEINGKYYPPKEVMRYAHEQMNGEKLWEFGGGHETTKYLISMGFSIVDMNSDPIYELLNKYKAQIKKIGLEGEVYKWELLAKYKGRPNLESPEFYEEVKSVDFSNLIYEMGKSVIRQLAKEKPKRYKECLSELFNESVPLTKRIIQFQNSVEEVFSEFNTDKKLSHHHDERTIATLLTYRNPDIYAFFKDSFYQKYCKLIGVSPKVKGEKYIHYLELIENLINDYINKDYELNRSFEDHLPDSVFQDENRKIVAQDILYTILDKGINEIEMEDYSVYKISMGVFKDVELDQCLAQQKVIVHKNTPAKATSNQKQGEIFENMRIGDFFYLTQGNGFNKMKLFGRVIGNSEPAKLDNLVEEGWIERSFEIIANSINKDAYKGKNKWWTPNNNSTITKIKSDDIDEANKLIFEPYFNIRLFNINKSKEESFDKDQEMKQTDKFDLNQILYGPPGTGKTYYTINKAIQIANPKFDLERARNEVKDEYQRLVNEGQIVFTTFHQSMSYEDFVEGIKPIEPNTENNQGDTLTYKTVDGIFKLICQKATEKSTLILEEANGNVEINETLLKESYYKLVNSLPDQEKKDSDMFLETKSDKSKFWLFKNSANTIVVKAGTKETNMSIAFSEISNVYFRGKTPNYKSYTHVIIEKLIEDAGHKEKLADNTKKNYILIIDEINRGNISSIFGELITLIEEDKRIGKLEELKAILPYSKIEFGVPKNLFIIGTMNTADRSVEALDTALRRRFSFEEMLPKPELLDPVFILDNLWSKYKELEWDDPDWIKAENNFLELYGGVINDRGKYEALEGKAFNESLIPGFREAISFSGLDLKQLLKTMNKRIEKLLSRDHSIGHSYFMCVYCIEDLKKTFYNKVIPLLQEYFFGDYGKIGLVLGEGFFENLDNENDLNPFATFFEYNGDDFADKTIYRLKSVDKMKNEEFMEAIGQLMSTLS